MKKKDRAKLNKYYTKKYGYDFLHYEIMWRDQGYCCALCGRKKAKEQKRFAQDHNHKTGVNRGIVCYYCNKYRIGRHDLASAIALFDYMHKYEGVND